MLVVLDEEKGSAMQESHRQGSGSRASTTSDVGHVLTGMLDKLLFSSLQLDEVAPQQLPQRRGQRGNEPAAFVKNITCRHQYATAITNNGKLKFNSAAGNNTAMGFCKTISHYVFHNHVVTQTRLYLLHLTLRQMSTNIVAPVCSQHVGTKTSCQTRNITFHCLCTHTKKQQLPLQPHSPSLSSMTQIPQDILLFHCLFGFIIANCDSQKQI
jgi:hypothetical protein